MSKHDFKPNWKYLNFLTQTENIWFFWPKLKISEFLKVLLLFIIIIIYYIYYIYYIIIIILLYLSKNIIYDIGTKILFVQLRSHNSTHKAPLVDLKQRFFMNFHVDSESAIKTQCFKNPIFMNFLTQTRFLWIFWIIILLLYYYIIINLNFASGS